MARRAVDEAVTRARFAVREVTNSRVSNDHHQADEMRAQRLRDIGWNDRADEISASDGAGVAR